MNAEKINRVKKILIKNGLDALVVRLPENILYLTGYWPITGWSLAVIFSDRDPILIVPESEAEFAENESWIKNIKTYPVESLKEIWNPYKYIEGILRGIDVKSGSLIGAELSFETMAANHVGGELNYPSNPTFSIIKRAWKSVLIDATDIIYELRMIKTKHEIEKMVKINRLAEFGLRELKNSLREGMTEIELAAICEKAIREKVGYEGFKRVRAYAFVMSGVNGSKAWYPYNISTNKTIRRGETVLVELNVFGDGYWTDITRTWYVGTPPQQIKDMYDTLKVAQDEYYKNIYDGIPANEADKIVRRFIEKRGYGKYFPHRLGHGIGVRLHEPPAIHPKSIHILKKNMTHTVEPGLYGKNFGIRIEDVIQVLDKGAKRITTYEREIT